MPGEDAGSIIDVAIDHKPEVVLGTVLLDFLPRELLVRNATILLRGGELVFDRWCRPAVVSFGVQGVSGNEVAIIIGAELDDILTIVHHTHCIPIAFIRLSVLERLKQRTVMEGARTRWAESISMRQSNQVQNLDSMSAAKVLPASFARFYYSKRDNSKAHHHFINVILYYKNSLSGAENRRLNLS